MEIQINSLEWVLGFLLKAIWAMREVTVTFKTKIWYTVFSAIFTFSKYPDNSWLCFVQEAPAQRPPEVLSDLNPPVIL